MSSLYIYLKDEIRNDAEYTLSNNSNNIAVVSKKGRTYTTDFEIDTNFLPYCILKHLIEISFKDNFSSNVVHREIGRYADVRKYGQSFAILDKKRPDVYEIKIIGNNLKEIKCLYTAIRCGTIRPYESWENTQQRKT